MAQKPSSINLLKTKGRSFFDKFLEWALTVGRILVILTEIIALSAFLYRFSLDRKLIDLHDEIKLKETYVNALKASENKYRNLQERLTLTSQFEAENVEMISFFKDVWDLAPSDFIFNNVKVSQDSVRIDASVQSISSLTRFIDGLKKYPNVRSVSLDKVENKTSTATIVVSITANIKRTN